MTETIEYEPEEDESLDLTTNQDIWYWISLMLDILLDKK